jgi:hypothetical protein
MNPSAPKERNPRISSKLLQRRTKRFSMFAGGSRVWRVIYDES